jgi:hypothetical protein
MCNYENRPWQHTGIQLVLTKVDVEDDVFTGGAT